MNNFNLSLEFEPGSRVYLADPKHYDIMFNGSNLMEQWGWPGEGVVQSINHTFSSDKAETIVVAYFKGKDGDIGRHEGPWHHFQPRKEMPALEAPKLNMGVPVAPLEIKPLPEPEVGQVWINQKHGCSIKIVQTRVDHKGTLRDRVSEGDIYIYLDLVTKKYGARGTHFFEREMAGWELQKDESC